LRGSVSNNDCPGIKIEVIENKNEFEDFENEFNVNGTNSPDMVRIDKQEGSFVSDNDC
jgi:hypothetical protein